MYEILRWLLFRFPAETAHNLAFLALRGLCALPMMLALLRRALRPPNIVAQTVWGRALPSPIGLAAGFDKDGRGYDALLALGFGFVEVGTVTGEGQPGNPRPRLFRLPKDQAIVNRMGFNNEGALSLATRLRRGRSGVVGANIGKTKRVPEEKAAEDYDKSARWVAPHADYVVVNVSSPNTPGLRNLQAVEQLEPLLRTVRQAMDEAASTDLPLLVKIAPDLSDEDIDAIADVALRLPLHGVIATNTTVQRRGLLSSPAEISAVGAGGLSGRPLSARSVHVLRRLRARVGDSVPLISVGGIRDIDDVWERLEAGAALVQLYTGFIYGGPLLPWRLNRALARRMRERALTSVADIARAAPPVHDISAPSREL